MFTIRYKDTYRGEITNPLSRNLYLYTNNDPVNYVDPSGHFLSKLIGYVNATVQSVKDIGQGIVNFVKNPSYDNFVNQVKNTTSKIISNYSSVNETEKKRKDERTYEEKELDRILKVKQGPVLNTQNTNQKGAATNQKAEQSKLYEYQIKELRKLNTKKANEIADALEKEMKKLCDSNLPQIRLYEPSINYYNKSKAVQYAFEYVYTPNTNEYRYFNDGDCANFVSQSLAAGGIQPREDWQTKQRLPFDIFGISRYEVTESWSNVSKQMQYFKDKGFVEEEYRVKSMEELREITKYIEPGDVAYISTEYNNTPTHAILLTSVTEDDVCYTAHTSPRKNQSIFEKYFNLYDPDNIEHAQNEKDIQPLMVIYHIKDKIKK